MMTRARQLVPIGRVLRTHGTRGEMVIDPYLTEMTFYHRLQEVMIGLQDGRMQCYAVQHGRTIGEQILLQLEVCTSIESVQPLIGADLYAPRDELPPPNGGEFYWHDLEGLSVYTQEGAFLGRVEDFFATGSNDVLVVRDGSHEILLPFIKDVILSVDEAQGSVRVRALPGLL